MSVSTTIKKFGLETVFKYLYKDPEKNLPKLMDWADKFSKGEFSSQRDAIRTDHHNGQLLHQCQSHRLEKTGGTAE